MKCTDKEWQHCQVEKMGCKGCYYDEIEVNEFVRTKSGHIFKVDSEKKVLQGLKFLDAFYGEIIKHSKNLIDIVEIGDVVECIVEVVAGEEIDTEKFEVAATGVKDIKGNSTNEIGVCGEKGINLIPFVFVKKILTKEQYIKNCFEVVQE